MRKALTAFALIGASAAASPVWAEARALVVGINEYDQGAPLFGAVADAQDISASLKRFGVQDVTMLLNRQASKAAIESAWREMTARAAPGDTLIFSYAGHGYKEPDQNGDEALVVAGDKEDENLILSAHSSANPLERIVDDELDLWFAAALDKGVKVLFVADTCHAGTLHRGGSAGRSAPHVSAFLNERTPDLARLTPPAALAPLPPNLGVRPNLFFVSAIDQAYTVKEVTIDGRKRGALSYAFARALDGAADYNKDGALDHLELGEYLETVSVAYDDETRRKFWPDGGPAQTVLTRSLGGAAPPSAAAVRPAPTDLRLALRGSASLGALNGARIVSDAPDLTYDVAREEVQDDQGVRVAEKIRPLAQALQPILDKYRIVKFVREMAAASPLRAHLSPEAAGGFHVIGDRVSIHAPEGGRPWLTVFNLANKGEVQIIFPYEPGEESHRLSRTPYDFTARIQEPPGADHLILIASDQEPTALRAALKAGADAPQILELLRRMSAAGGVSANVVPFYTRRTQ